MLSAKNNYKKLTALKETEFVIFDVETTGLYPAAGDRMVEVAALKVRGLKPVEEFHSFVDPQREISFGAALVNGISSQMLEGAPPAKEVIPRLLNFFRESYLIGHNIKFDLGFLYQEVSLAGLRLEKELWTIDTMRMARKLLPGLGRYPLWWVAQSLGIDTRQEHRAMADVYLTWDVFKKLLEVVFARDLNEIEFLSQMLS